MKDNIVSFFQYFLWKRKIKEVHTHSEASVRRVFRSIAQNGFDYYGESVPYGRAKWFIESEKEFYNEFSNTEFEYFGYSPVRSLKEEDFKEYGLLLTQYGIFEKMQIKDQDRCNVQFFPFSNLWKVEVDDNDQLAFYYPYGIIKRLNVSNSLNYVVRELNELIASGYTNDVQVESLNTQLLKIGKKNVNSTTFRRGTEIGVVSWVLLSVGDRLHKAQINAMVSAPSGHGHAAEYANNVIDRIKYPFQDVKQIGQNNAKNGADRMVGNQKIQTKYYNNARGTVNAAFESKNDGGMYKYNGMQLEVPKDQYDKAVELFEEKIRQGKVEGVNNPAEAKNIIRKGHITYNEAKLIAKGGNLTSIKFDAIDGAINSLPGVGISFVIVFSQAKWSGAETKDAALMAGKAGLRTLAMGTSIYVASQQFSKIFTNQINKYFGKKVTAEVVARRAAPVISFAVIMAPDIFEALVGRISSQQLLKNAAVAGGGMMAGAGAGAVGGAIAGPIGALAGTIIGGIAGGIGAKAIADQFIEDDRVEMFAQLKEDSRTYAKEFVEEKVKSIIKDREQVELKEIIDAIQVLNSSGNSSDSGWNQYDGAWYYLNNSSSLATGWIQDNDNWYYLNDDGTMATGWLKDKDVWYYLKDNGAMATGWIQDDGNWYYLNDNGSMVTGWYQVGEKWYYSYSSGELAVNTTIDGYRVNEKGECMD